jgi:hypothetical protein
MTDTVSSHNIDLSSWDTCKIRTYLTLWCLRKEKEKAEKERGGCERQTFLKEMGTENFSILKVSRQYPVKLMIKSYSK